MNDKKVRIQSSKVRAPRQIIGIDIGDRVSRVCVLSGDCVIVREEPLPTTPEAFLKRFGGLGRCRTVIEAGAHSPWISRLLEKLGHEVIIANTRQVRLIYESDSKNDRGDALTLARLARVDPGLLRPIHHRSVEAQSDLAILRARDVLVSGRTSRNFRSRKLEMATSDAYWSGAHSTSSDISASIQIYVAGDTH